MAVAETSMSDLYQPLCPLVPVTLSPTSGGTVSTRALWLPINELSPHDDNAQKLKLLSPSPIGMLQLVAFGWQAKLSPFRVPSISRMVCSLNGSLALNASSGTEAPLHQPFCTVQFTDPAIVAEG